MEFVASLQHSALVTWILEAPTVWAYPTVLTLHVLGMGLLVGTSSVVDLRILGFGPDVPLASLARLFRVIWIGFWVSAVSGTLLFATDATHKATQVVFFVKLAFVVLGLNNLTFLKTAVFRDLKQVESGEFHCSHKRRRRPTASCLSGRFSTPLFVE